MHCKVTERMKEGTGGRGDPGRLRSLNSPRAAVRAFACAAVAASDIESNDLGSIPGEK